MTQAISKKKTVIVISSILVVVVASTIFLSKVNWNAELALVLKKQVNNRLNNARMSFRDFDFSLSKTDMMMNFGDLSIMDLEGKSIIHAKNLSVDIDPRQLLAFRVKLKRIATEYLQVRAVRGGQLKWNLEKLFKAKSGLFSTVLGEFDFADIDLEVTDLPSLNQVNYEGLRLNIKPEGGHIDINIETQETKTNYIKVFGMIPRAKRKSILDEESKLKVKIVELEPLTLNLISALLLSKSEWSSLVDSYISGTTLSLNFDYDNDDQGGKLLKVKSRVTDLEDIKAILFESWAKITDDIQFQKTYFSFDETDLQLHGSIKNWQKKNAKLDLQLDVQDLNLFDLVDDFQELEYYIPSFILEIFNILHGNDYLNGRLNFSSAMKSPEIVARLKINTKDQLLLSSPSRRIIPTIINKEEEITAKLHYEGSKIKVEEFNLPIDYSVLAVRGDYDLEEHSFEINLAAEDLPLVKLAPIAASIPLLKEYRKTIARSQVDGYATMDLNIVRLLDQQRKLVTVVRGPCRFAQLNYSSSDYPLAIKDINASFDINGDVITINNFAGSVFKPDSNLGQNQNYIEAKGQLNLAKVSLAKLEVASPKIEAQTLLDSGVLSLISDKFTLDAANGSFQDVLFKLDSNGKDMDIDFNMKIDSVDLSARNQSINNLQGVLSYEKNRIDFDDLSFSLNRKSFLELDGSVFKDFSKPDIQFKAQKLNFVDIMNLVNGASFGVKPLAGYLDVNLQFHDDDINGNLAFDHIALLYKDLDKYPITDLNGDLVITKNLATDNLSVNYGPTSIRDVTGILENYKSKDVDRSLELSLQAILNVDDFYHFIPSSMQKFLKISGRFPVNLGFKGNKLKKQIKVKADIDQADEFIFGDWFVLKKDSTQFKLITDFTMTPQLISSNDSRLVFIDDSGDAVRKTKIRSKFHIEDYASKEDLSYFVGFQTSLKDGSQSLNSIEPHIVSLQPLNLKMGDGNLSCDTYGNFHDRQTICEFKVTEATAVKYGIGDLNAKDINVDLLSIANEPLDVHIEIVDGDWNTIPYNKLKLDLNANGDYIYVRDLKAKVLNGIARGQFDYNYKTLDSKFKLEGRDLPAHHFAQGIWGFGSEVPEGTFSGVFEGTTSGYMPDPMFYNLVATTNLILKQGKLSQLILMQKVLTAVNTLRNFDLNNIFQTLVTYKGGTFDHVISSIKYDHGVMSSEKVLLKAPQMELNLNGYFDYNNDQQWVQGKGLIPKKSKSILQSIGVGKVNLGNLLSLDDLTDGGSKEKRFFDFKMVGPISDPDKSAESLKSNFKWL